jgi:serine/threonine-protein kinase HipA
VEGAAEFFGLGLAEARGIIGEVGRAVATWREVAVATGARPGEIRRMASAFDHDDLARARAL